MMRNLSLKDLRKNKKKKKGFTLVELIIVIAIMAILAAVAIPRFGEVTRNANATADLATAKNLHGIAAQLIAQDPTTTTNDLLTEVPARVDGGVMPTSKITGTAFVVTYDRATGDIIVTNGTDQVYPEVTTP